MCNAPRSLGAVSSASVPPLRFGPFGMRVSIYLYFYLSLSISIHLSLYLRIYLYAIHLVVVAQFLQPALSRCIAS